MCATFICPIVLCVLSDIISGEDVDAMQGRLVRTERSLVPALNHQPPSVYFGVRGITATRILVTSFPECAVSYVLHKTTRKPVIYRNTGKRQHNKMHGACKMYVF